LSLASFFAKNSSKKAEVEVEMVVAAKRPKVVATIGKEEFVQVPGPGNKLLVVNPGAEGASLALLAQLKPNVPAACASPRFVVQAKPKDPNAPA
jgi:hypothetical protein